MESNRVVSVIMPAYNSAQYISEAIESVIAQTYTRWELIIIDDASRDHTNNIIQDFAKKDTRIKFLWNSTNLGTHHTRNKGIEAAEGDFIAFLDADDQWKPQKLQKQVDLLVQGNTAACFASYDLIAENGEALRKQVQALPVLTYEKLLKANYVGNLTGIYNAKLLGKIYNPEIAKRQDWAMWLKVIEEGGPMEGIQESLAIYRQRKDSISRNKLEMIRYNFNVYHKILGFDLISSLWKMLIFLNEQLFVKPKQVKTIPVEK